VSPTILSSPSNIDPIALASSPRYSHTAAIPAAADSMALWATAANLTHLAFAHAQAGDMDNACTTALQASSAVRRTGSARHAALLTRICANLQTQSPNDPRVTQLAETLR
jgi:hypothetical protein